MMLKLTFLMTLKTFTKILLQEVSQLKNNNRVNHLGLLMDFQTFLKVNLSVFYSILSHFFLKSYYLSVSVLSTKVR